MMQRSFLIISLIYIHTATWMTDYVSAAVTGPNKSYDTPIRLVDAKIASKHVITKTSPQETYQKPLHTTPESTFMNRALSNEGESRSDFHTSKPQDTTNNKNNIHQHRVVIVEPTTGSLLEGNKFVVVLKIQSTNETQFRETYIENKEGRICLSLDQSPYVCWPPYGRMFFTHATEGEHTIVAKLWRNEILEESTTSEMTSFTTIFNPKIVQEESNEKSRPHQHSLESNNHGTYHDDRRENGEGGKSEIVNVTYPIVQIKSPLKKVSYSGTSLPFESELPILHNREMFEKYFRTAFVCINIDIATAFSCFPIFDPSINQGHNNQTNPNIPTSTNNKAIAPWLLGLNKGMHTMEAMLSHPETGDLLTDSSSGTVMFFMTGDQNEGAAFIGSINIRGKRYEIPVMQGGCLEAQTQAFCHGIKLGLSCFRKHKEPKV